MGRSQETFSKKEVRNKKEKKRKDKQAKMLARKENPNAGAAREIAYLDEYGNLTTTPPDPTAKKKEVDLDSIQIGTPKKEDLRNEDPVRNGVVTFFNDSKGYGFIKDSESQESIFVHVNSVRGEISEGAKVRFEVMMGQKGPAATNVTLVE